MKRSDLPKLTPLAAVLGGCAVLFLRMALYLQAVDHTGRIAAGHPLSWAILILCLGMALLCLLGVKGQKGSGLFEENFPVSFNAFVGYLAFAYGILMTVLRGQPHMPGALGIAWKAMGLLCVPSLAAAGWHRLRGKTPPVLACLAVPLFLTLHLIDHYQFWCSNPQIQDVAFPLFATIALTATAYQHAAFAADMGSRRQLLLAGNLAIFLCLGELAVTDSSLLYTTGVFWAATGLCEWKEVGV